ncbi:tumor necrosis factor receptor superfamily member 27 isoform X1 [Crotalus tigris]|uniref:tumor necrosis factor receptor superfamily member 27 isoform X1 n=1 Tax=Crotalus tigris TaxID=88082 RepID=UPI00192F9D11|nr:tumor necrosis factor receptor superfamily member 27 isoform X1 [Crotalus tigris]XP_039220320.1 tumor necrosis factor receptor superfamily member 27 isoform X1 [Crotalus tigris]XP_039220321.1 tumor necrosis factor receptor superfamily member 27 isoform X1 [Crotalus tigris]
MEKGAALRLTLIIVAEALASQSMANPVECRESEYLDNHGKCSPCKECGPGFELSKECGYGEGRGAECSPCQPRRFKDSWGVHGCKSCVSCTLINRAQKSNCSATSDATCGGCFPGFYSKTQIGGFQDLECVPCTKQTPSSEQQCLSRIGLEESSTDPVQDPALVVLTSSALVLLVLVLLTVAVLYCQQFWKSQCQHVFLKSQTVSGQRGTLRTSGLTGFHELPPDACSLDVKNFKSPYRSTEGPVRALQLIPGVDVSGSHLPHPQPDMDSSRLMIVTSKNPPARSPLETRPVMGASGLQSYSFPGGFSECREVRSRGPDGPAQPSSCARESQHCWPHTPVECTELDLQAFSAWAGKGTAKTETPGKQTLSPEVPPWSACPAAQPGLSLEAASVPCSSFQNPTLESGELLQSSSSSVSLEQPPR